MPQYKTKDIAKIVNGRLTGKGDEIITNILTDSRNLPITDNCIFFAFRGNNHDGHDYIDDLYKKQVFAFVVSHPPPTLNKYPEATFIIVKDTIIALQKLAAFHRKHYKKPIVAITGSNGKTIVKEWLFQVLTPEKNIIRSPKSYNSQIGVPLSAWLIDDYADMAIIEAGISKKGEMERLQKVIRPDIGLITNISEAHQENFKDYEEKAEEKLKLFTDAKTLIYCKDHKIIEQKIKKNKHWADKQFFTWSQHEPANLAITQIKKTGKHTIITGIHDNKEKKISIPFNDWAAIENGIHVWAFLLFIGYDDEIISSKMAALPPVAMRLEMKDGTNNCTIINDSYNSDLSSLEIALDFLSLQNQHDRKTVILSDIYQSGKSGNQLYQQIADIIHAKKINRLIGIGEAISQHQQLFNIKKSFFNNTDSFIRKSSIASFSNEAILIKGSRNFHFEHIVNMLEKKNHRTVLEINMNALTHNLNYFRSLLNPSTKLMAMVKASSYGSGLSEVANLLQYHRVDYLGVALVDEGILLRESGNQLPIMIINPEEGSYDKIITYNLEPEIYNFKGLASFSDMARQHGIFSYPVHIKLDTGMHRLGFNNDDMPSLVKFLKHNKQLKIKTVFSHLSASDEKQHDAFTKMQISRFDKMSNELISISKKPVTRHILNSGGIERFPEAQYDMVRLGIGLYGVSAVNQKKVLPISKLKSHIIQVKHLAAGETVGYGRKGILKTDSKIAVIPVGYADGLSRKLGNRKGKIMINNKFAPLIGNICMDMCMADITNIKASIGDEAIVFGDKYTILDMAKDMDTIPYEVLTGISGRVKRIYYQE